MFADFLPHSLTDITLEVSGRRQNETQPYLEKDHPSPYDNCDV